MGIPSATSQMLEAQSAAAQMERRMHSHNVRVAGTHAAALQQQYESKLARLERNYRIQTNNVANVEGTASTLTGELQVAIDIIMESTGQTFEQVKQSIIEHRNMDSYCDKAKDWFKTNPQFEGGLISDSRQAVSQ